MRPRVIVLTALSLTIAGGAAVMTNNWLQQQQGQAVQATAAPAPVEAPKETRILVADGALTAGTILKPEHLRWQAWPADGLLDVYVVDRPISADADAEPAGRADLIGAVVRAGMVDGEPITDKRVVRPGDRGFLAAMLAEGHRALSVPVNAASGISGLIFPGDRVDVILSHSIRDQSGGRNERKASETVLSDIRVLALDQRTDDVEGERVVAKTATLEVAPKEAEKLSLAQKLGDLSLSLRPIARAGDPAEPAGPTFTTDTEISRVMSAPRNKRGPTVVVVRGSEMTGIELEE